MDNNCNHKNVEVTEHLTGEGAMEYIEWFDHKCLDCGKTWTTNDGENEQF